ncbi:MAG: RluA family pseudouridine synthase [Bacteroidales bacterium]|nr:RluA family pseudouridine synthase [Bacteroidales bacterium]MDT8431655.1 RluA family pseudouridine synthase [Bacteroidales bacterium]
MEVLYEDNHLVVLNKSVSDIVQGDQTGDVSLDQKLKGFLKERDAKPGNVFVGIPHRLDRPVSGVVVYTKTGKALRRMTSLFREKEVEKNYLAVVGTIPDPMIATLEHYLTRNTKQNKSYCHSTPARDAKHAVLHYRHLASSDRYHLLEIRLETGRHHQIRAQLAAIGCPIKGDVKYGAKRPNRDGGISLHARRIAFLHPVKNTQLEVVAPFPARDIFHLFGEDQGVRL